MHYDIRQEAGPAFAMLGRLVEEMTPQIVPHLQLVTALPLPARLIVRIVTVEEWMRLWAAYDEQLLEAEIAALSPTPGEIKQARATLRFKREQHRVMPVGAQTVNYYDDGYASLVVLADNLRAGESVKGEFVDTDYLCKLLAHELTHVGQVTAGGEEYRLLSDTPFPKRRRLSQRNIWFADEGFADWADGQITSRILGGAQKPEPVPNRPADPRVAPSRWGNEEMAQVMNHVLGAGSAGTIGSAQHRQTVDRYAAAGRAMGEVIAACGVEAVTRMWTQHDLLPTDAEERDPLAWQRRLMGLPPRTQGPGDVAAAFVPGIGTRSFVVPTPPAPGRP